MDLRLLMSLALATLAIRQAVQAMEHDKKLLNEKLLVVAGKGNTGEVIELLKQGADVNFADRNGASPLHKVCSVDCLEAAKMLIERGADINLATCIGWTPLHVACIRGYSKMVELLIEHGAYINRQNADGKTVFDIASKHIATIIMQEQKRRMEKKEVLQQERLWAYLQRNNADNLGLVLKMLNCAR